MEQLASETIIEVLGPDGKFVAKEKESFDTKLFRYLKQINRKNDYLLYFQQKQLEEQTKQTKVLKSIYEELRDINRKVKY